METDFRTAAPDPADPDLPRISVLVMGHNQQDFMAACVDSVLAQQYDGWVEVVLCDDCSTDGTYEIMLQKAKEYRGPFRVIAHRCPVNGRVAVNMNVAVSLSEGDWLMRVDGDDIMHPDRLRLTALAIRRFPGTTGISGARSIFSGEPESVVNPADEELEYLVYSKDDYGDDSPAGLCWWGCAMTFTRRVFTEFGDMPAECAVLDDTMFATRILMLGQFVIINNGYLVYYRRHAGNMSSPEQFDNTYSGMLKLHLAGMDYMRRGLPCLPPILAELQKKAQEDASCIPMTRWFERCFAMRRFHCFVWEQSWWGRVRCAPVCDHWWRRLFWALRVISPHTYVATDWFRRRFSRRNR